MPLLGLFPLLLLFAVIVGAIVLIRSAGRTDGVARPERAQGLDALSERYARGEIGRDEYLQKKHDIAGDGATLPTSPS